MIALVRHGKWSSTDKATYTRPESKFLATIYNMASARGCLFVIEGLDRAGKSTQAKLLAQHLRKTTQECVHASPKLVEVIGNMLLHVVRE